jgi:hypothetical protein
MPISNPDIKKLYGLSAGRCNLCNISLFKKNIDIGEMAHIIAKNYNGARGSKTQVNDNRYENLILLCPNCHTKVDKDPNNYSIEFLISVKQRHEQNIQEQLSNNKKDKQQDIDALKILMQYWNFFDLVGLVNTLPNYIHLNFFNVYDTFNDFIISYPQFRPFYSNELETYFIKFWNSYVDLVHIFAEQIPHSKISVATLQVFIQADFNLNIHLNKDLPHNVYNNYCQIIKQKKKVFLNNYYILLQFLKNHYIQVI